jgi:hypothetical protein
MDSDFYHLVFDLLIIAASLGYPMWQSFSLLEVKKYEKALIQWLSYWILYALLWKTESFFLLWLFHK